MSAAAPLGLPRFKATNQITGVPLAGGFVYTYINGTSTPKATYTDSTGTVANANPVVLNASGEADIFLVGEYKIVLKDASGITQWTEDNISQQLDFNGYSEWVPSGLIPTYVSATQFTVAGDQTLVLPVNRRIKSTVTAGTTYSTVSVVSYAAGTTTVTVTNSSGTLDSGLSSFMIGFISNGAAATTSLPGGVGLGTVTSVATGTGLTGGTITSTGTISLVAVANNTVLGNISGGSAASTPQTIPVVDSITLSGGTKAGQIALISGATPVVSPASGVSLWSNSNGLLGTLLPTGFTATQDFSAISANRTYTWPNSATSIPILTQTITITGPSAARTWTVPDANFTLSRIDAAQTVLGVNTYTVAGPQIILGVNTTTLGSIKMFGNTSGDATVQPAAVAGTSTVVTLPNASSTLPIFGQQITFTGPTAARSYALVDAAETLAVLGTAQTYTATETHKQIVFTNNAITASGNAATVPITSRINTVTNNSAAALTITMTTTSAVDRQLSEVLVLDFSAVAQTITWVNTENSAVIAPIISNGSTTLPVSVLFQFNNATTKWRCIASA